MDKEKECGEYEKHGGLSAEIQESLNNFKVIIAFNRRDYFRKRFEEINDQNYGRPWMPVLSTMYSSRFTVFSQALPN